MSENRYLAKIYQYFLLNAALLRSFVTFVEKLKSGRQTEQERKLKPLLTASFR